MDGIKEIVSSVAAHEVMVDPASSPYTLIIAADDLLVVSEKLFRDPTCFFDMLSCVTGIDNGVTTDTMDVIYNLYSIPFNRSIMLRVRLPRANPSIESLTGIWKSANWLERETYDMLGIIFLNHPYLQRILLPADWEGHPLRKDYQHQETYRDIKVKY